MKTGLWTTRAAQRAIIEVSAVIALHFLIVFYPYSLDLTSSKISSNLSPLPHEEHFRAHEWIVNAKYHSIFSCIVSMIHPGVGVFLEGRFPIVLAEPLSSETGLSYSKKKNRVIFPKDKALLKRLGVEE